MDNLYQQHHIAQEQEAQLTVDKFRYYAKKFMKLETKSMTISLTPEEADERESAYVEYRTLQVAYDGAKLILGPKQNEMNKYQMEGKLLKFDPQQQQFIECGYGELEIKQRNDQSHAEILHGRLLMILDKEFQILLNSLIFREMSVNLATNQCVRFTAKDELQLKTFLIESTPAACTQFVAELGSFIQMIKQQDITESV